MAGSAGLAAGMTALAGAVLSEDSLHGTLARVALLSADAVPGVTGAGVTWSPGEGPAMVEGSHGFARRLEQLQYRTGEGPGVQAHAAQQVVRAVIAAGRPRWPGFSGMALGEGITAVLAAPLTAGGGRLGTLSLYAQSAAAFGDVAAAEAMMFAEHAAYVLACARELTEARSLARNLQLAMESRAAIEQAKGIVMARERCDPQRAFDLLRAASQCSHVKLCDIAGCLVDSTASHDAGRLGRWPASIGSRPAPVRQGGDRPVPNRRPGRGH